MSSIKTDFWTWKHAERSVGCVKRKHWLVAGWSCAAVCAVDTFLLAVSAVSAACLGIVVVLSGGLGGLILVACYEQTISSTDNDAPGRKR